MALIYEDETYQLLGACFEVYKEKGCGFHENVFQECLEIEFRLRSIPAIAKPKMKLEYKGQVLAATFEPDFVCYGKIIVELKAVSKLIEEHDAQVLNYQGVEIPGRHSRELRPSPATRTQATHRRRLLDAIPHSGGVRRKARSPCLTFPCPSVPSVD